MATKNFTTSRKPQGNPKFESDGVTPYGQGLPAPVVAAPSTDDKVAAALAALKAAEEALETASDALEEK